MLVQGLVIIIPRFFFIIKPLFQFRLTEFISLIFKDLILCLFGFLGIMIFSSSLELVAFQALIFKVLSFIIFYAIFLFYLKKDLITYTKYLIAK
jgi:hypothetical protein